MYRPRIFAYNIEINFDKLETLPISDYFRKYYTNDVTVCFDEGPMWYAWLILTIFNAISILDITWHQMRWQADCEWRTDKHIAMCYATVLPGTEEYHESNPSATELHRPQQIKLKR